MKISSSVLDDAISQLETLKRKAEELNGEHSFSFKELFNDDFMKSHTKYHSISDFCEASGLDFSSQEAFRNINTSDLDKFVNDNSDFHSWEEMKSSAGKALIASKLKN